MPLSDDTTTWIAVGLAVGAIALTLVVIVTAGAFYVRSRKSAKALADEMLNQSSTRFEAMVTDFVGALERAEDESRRSRQLGTIRESLDLDAVLTRTLDAAASFPGIDAAMIILPEGAPNRNGPKPLIASVGLSEAESMGQPLGGPPDGLAARAVTISYRYPPELESDDGLIRGGLEVPLFGGADEPVGTLAVFWRGGGEAGAEEDRILRVEQLAASAGPAVENARRFREAKQLADLDALTSLHNRRFFHETLGREVARAQRYDRRLGLVVLDVDDFKAINDRVGHLAGDTLLAEIGERIQSVVRGADVACRIGGDEFAVILPESTRADADELYRRLELAVASRPVGSSDRLHLSAGIAEIRTEDDATSFFERADEALYRAKQTGKGHAVTAEREF